MVSYHRGGSSYCISAYFLGVPPQKLSSCNCQCNCYGSSSYPVVSPNWVKNICCQLCHPSDSWFSIFFFMKAFLVPLFLSSDIKTMSTQLQKSVQCHFSQVTHCIYICECPLDDLQNNVHCAVTCKQYSGASPKQLHLVGHTVNVFTVSLNQANYCIFL